MLMMVMTMMMVMMMMMVNNLQVGGVMPRIEFKDENVVYPRLRPAFYI